MTAGSSSSGRANFDRTSGPGRRAATGGLGKLTETCIRQVITLPYDTITAETKSC